MWSASRSSPAARAWTSSRPTPASAASSSPQVVAVPVLGGQNAPGVDADGEVMLDIEVAGVVAPRARIAVYFAPNTDQRFLTALTDAVHDSTNRPSVISISWGSAEANWS